MCSIWKKKKELLIPKSELEFGKEIGKGAFGIVYKGLKFENINQMWNCFFEWKKKLGSWRSTPVAIKQILASKMNEKQIKDFVAEISLMKSLRPHGKFYLNQIYLFY